MNGMSTGTYRNPLGSSMCSLYSPMLTPGHSRNIYPLCPDPTGGYGQFLPTGTGLFVPGSLLSPNHYHPNPLPTLHYYSTGVRLVS